MIERVLIKDYLSFKSVAIEPKEGLVAFTGASGAGKTLFMQGLLTLFGLQESEATLVEVTFNGKLPMLEEFGLLNEEPNVLKYLKQKNARYFINSQSVSKKNMQQICSLIIQYLSLRDESELKSQSLLELLDNLIAKSETKYLNKLQEYKLDFDEFLLTKEALEKVENEEKKIVELKEFARYEIEAIEAVNPSLKEDEELMSLKKTLSKKEKLQSAMNEASGIFEFEDKVSEVLSLSDMASDFFDECMNELRAALEESQSRLDELEDIDIESLLERIEQISKLKTRYGEIEEILEHKKKRQAELEHYENIAFEKKHIEEKFKTLQSKIETKAQFISQKRALHVKKLEKIINDYLKKLYLDNATLELSTTKFHTLGQDDLQVSLNHLDIKKISSGELNRLRLAFIATKNELCSIKNGGVLILDEVDANLSGKEAMSVANVLKELSNAYQVLAISHQPQLSSIANEHYLVSKSNNESTITLLDKKSRVLELARMVSGEEIKEEALEFATKLLSET